MSSPENSSNGTIKASSLFSTSKKSRRRGGITEALGFPRRKTLVPSSSPNAPIEPLNPIASITLEDIQTARNCGAGGFGAVVVFNHPKLGQIALKKLTTSKGQKESDLRPRTVREGNTWRGLTHPNILPLLGVLETFADLYLVSPYVKNGSLDNFIRENPDVDRQRLLAEAAAAIVYLHECSIVHGDIKASNILVSDDIHALLCDFGLARSEDAVTSVGLLGVGTVRYSSPELLERGGGKTFESDVWAFGMTIYEVLSGNIPFHGDGTVVIINVLLYKDERPPTLPSHSPTGKPYTRIWNVAKCCWQKDAALRPSMKEVHRQLSSEGVALKGHTRVVSCLAFSSDSRILTSGSADKTIRFWDVESGDQSGKPLIGHTDYVRCIAFSPDGTTVASGSDDESIRFWDVTSRRQRGEPMNGHSNIVSCLAFSPDGTTIISGSGDRTVRRWDVESRSQRGEPLEGHTGPVWCVALSPDGRRVASGSWDKSLRLWDAASGSQRGEPLKGHTAEVWGLAFSLDGTIIVSGSWDKTIRLWDVESGMQIGESLRGHTGYISCLAFSPDGKTILSGSGDKTIRIWDMESKSQRGKPLREHTGAVWCMALSPDGTIVVSGSGANKLLLREIDP